MTVLKVSVFKRVDCTIIIFVGQLTWFARCHSQKIRNDSPAFLLQISCWKKNKFFTTREYCWFALEQFSSTRLTQRHMGGILKNVPNSAKKKLFCQNIIKPNVFRFYTCMRNWQPWNYKCNYTVFTSSQLNIRSCHVDTNVNWNSYISHFKNKMYLLTSMKLISTTICMKYIIFPFFKF